MKIGRNGLIASIVHGFSIHLYSIKHTSIKTKILLSTAVFFASLLTYLFACPEWFFDGEDWGLIFKGSRCTGLKDFFGYFVQGNVNHLIPTIVTENPTALATMKSHDSFFIVYYRPMLLAMHAIQYQLFGLNAYAYFTLAITIHATIAALIFYQLTYLVQPGIAFLCSLYFTFHPTLYGWFGKIDTLQNLYDLFTGIIVVILLRKSLIHKSILLYFASCALFFLCLLTRETLILLPVVIFLWLHIFSKKPPYQYFNALQKQLMVICGFCCVIFLYLFMRSIAYPFIMLGEQSIIMPNSDLIFQPMYLKAITLIQNLYNFLWSQWIPTRFSYDFFRDAKLLSAYKFIKLVIILCVTSLFITNTKKQFIILSLITALIVYLPPLIGAGGGLRLFYEALSFMILALAYLLQYSTLLTNRLAKSAIYGLLALLIGFNGYAIIRNMHSRIVMTKKIDTALKRLKESTSHALTNQPFLILSTHGISNALGITQAIELYDITTNNRYFFCNLIIHTSKGIERIEQLVRTEKHENSIRLISLAPEKIWFKIDNIEEKGQPITLYVNQAIADNRIIDLSLNFEKDFYNQDLMVLVWLFEQGQFVSIG